MKVYVSGIGLFGVSAIFGGMWVYIFHWMMPQPIPLTETWPYVLVPAATASLAVIAISIVFTADRRRSKSIQLGPVRGLVRYIPTAALISLALLVLSFASLIIGSDAPTVRPLWMMFGLVFAAFLGYAGVPGLFLACLAKFTRDYLQTAESGSAQPKGAS